MSDGSSPIPVVNPFDSDRHFRHSIGFFNWPKFAQGRALDRGDIGWLFKYFDTRSISCIIPSLRSLYEAVLNVPSLPPILPPLPHFRNPIPPQAFDVLPLPHFNYGYDPAFNPDAPDYNQQDRQNYAHDSPAYNHGGQNALMGAQNYGQLAL
ncbi:hypothetical protein KI387_002122, partial [Taxus chinensis]